MSAFGFCRPKPYKSHSERELSLTAPKQHSSYCGEWGHLMNKMKRERTSYDVKYQGLLPEYLDLHYTANIQDTMGAM